MYWSQFYDTLNGSIIFEIMLSIYGLDNEIFFSCLHRRNKISHSVMGNLHYKLNFDPRKTTNSFITAWKSIPKQTNLASLVAKCSKIMKILRSLRIFTEMYYARKSLPFLCQFCPKCGLNTNSQTSRDYIFLILQHFATQTRHFY